MTRYLLLAVACLFGSSAAHAGEVEPLLPAETEQIIHVNMKKILESDIGKKFALPQLKKGLEDPKAVKFLEEIGLDPLTDIQHITMGIWGEGSKDKGPPTTLAIIHGNFDPKKLFEAAEKYSKDMKDKIEIVDEADFKLIRFVDGGGRPSFAAVADEKTIVTGSDKKSVVDALTAASKEAKPQLSKELTALVKKQDDKASMFYCGVLDDKFKNLPEIKLPNLPLGNWPLEGGKINDGLKNLSTMAVTVRLGKEVLVDLAMGMKDVDSADDFGVSIGMIIETIKTLLPLAALQNPKLSTLVDEVKTTLKHKVKGKDITLTMKLTMASFAKLTGEILDDDD